MVVLVLVVVVVVVVVAVAVAASYPIKSLHECCGIEWHSEITEIPAH
jgi:hypothetical protein